MDECVKLAAVYVATLRAIAIMHQNHHWVTNGSTFYSDHLLLDRLYESVDANVDTAAEKFVGLFGNECLDYTLHAELIHKLLLKYKSITGILERSLKAEEDFCAFTKEIYACFEKEDKLTHGLDDMLSAICSDRESAIYLLKQRLT